MYHLEIRSSLMYDKTVHKMCSVFLGSRGEALYSGRRIYGELFNPKTHVSQYHLGRTKRKVICVKSGVLRYSSLPENPLFSSALAITNLFKQARLLHIQYDLTQNLFLTIRNVQLSKNT